MTRRAPIAIDGHSLTLDQVCAIAGRAARARLAREVAGRVNASRRVVENVLAGDGIVYGVNTGFGQLANVRISPDKLRELQLNLIRSHAAGVGKPADSQTVRALLVLRANVLARGHSGIRLSVLKRLLTLLDHDILPIVPEQGSVGASGDLAPLAHVALSVIGEGPVLCEGRRMSARRALSSAGLNPIELEAKEGLALINGTQFGCAIACLALDRALTIARTADVTCALTVESLLGTCRAFDPRIHDARPHAGQRSSAQNLRRLMRRSQIWKSHENCRAVQDAYSLRCAPQVHGAARDALDQLSRVLSIEINSSTDNPMVFVDQEEILSGGNFHGAPLAAAADYASIALTALASIVERRTDRLVNPLVSGLPAFLARNPGVESGLMLAQVTSAALVSECKTLAHPGSCDSIPTSGLQEDHVSMSPWCTRKLKKIVSRIETLLAIELLTAARAIEHHRPLRSSKPLEAVLEGVRETVRIPRGDFPPGPVIEKLAAVVRTGTIIRWAREGGVDVV